MTSTSWARAIWSWVWAAADVEARRTAPPSCRASVSFRARRVGLGGVGQQPGLGVEAAQVEVGVGELGLEAQAHRGRVGAAGLGLGLAGGDQVAHPAPEVDLVGERAAEQVVVIVVRAGRQPQRPVGRLAVGGRRAAERRSADRGDARASAA